MSPRACWWADGRQLMHFTFSAELHGSQIHCTGPLKLQIDWLTIKHLQTAPD